MEPHVKTEAALSDCLVRCCADSPEHSYSTNTKNDRIPNSCGQAISPTHLKGGHFPVLSMPPGQYYGQSMATFTTDPYMSQNSSQEGQVRRKPVRAKQACNHCRLRKQKCDEARPCQFCQENGFDCHYKDVPPTKQDTSMMQLQNSVNNISETLKSFVEGFNSWKHSVEGRLPPQTGDHMAMVSHHASPEQNFGYGNTIKEPGSSRLLTSVQGRAQLRRVNSMKTDSPIVPHSNMSPVATQASGNAPKENTGLQSDHTTPAHQLLEAWPSMRPFFAEIAYFHELKNNGKHIQDYPMQLEQDRGILRTWGIGEGQDLNDGAQGLASPESSKDSGVPSPAPGKEGIWGCPPVDRCSPGTMSGDTPCERQVYQEGLGPDGRPNFHSRTLWSLHNSYHQNIHSLHPFLNSSQLRRMIEEFSDTYSPDVRPLNSLPPAPNQPNAGVKRKRSASIFGNHYSLARELCKGGIERSLRNAIVLLVLALGKVCEHKDPLPAPQGNRNSITNGSWGYTRESPHASSTSFSSEDSESRPRNIDILPGMAYFAYATDILGNQQGGNTVAHAQAMLLAALYLGQYARVLESWSWINNACRICLVLIKADLHKISRQEIFDGRSAQHFDAEENYRLNLVKCVYWTCLQLETDILAEMSSLPPSEISKYQGEISYPSGAIEKFPDQDYYHESTEDDKTMWIYSNQIYLRIILNDAHNTLYGATGRMKPPGFDTSNLKKVVHAARIHAEILSSWRRLLPQSLSWSDSEPPSTDINIARLRAKYYGGHYMILRPFLYLVTHEIELPPTAPITTTSTWSGHSSPAVATESTPTNREMFSSSMDLTTDQSDILVVAHECIKSAIQSTIAFDRVGCSPNDAYENYENTRRARLIVTNIFGTLHAQFGNMIVLAAVFKSRLKGFLPPDTKLTKSNLVALFKRTINVLNEIAPNSPILNMDLRILHNVQRQLGLV